jgi:hypothetical protein
MEFLTFQRPPAELPAGIPFLRRQSRSMTPQEWNICGQVARQSNGRAGDLDSGNFRICDSQLRLVSAILKRGSPVLQVMHWRSALDHIMHFNA